MLTAITAALARARLVAASVTATATGLVPVLMYIAGTVVFCYGVWSAWPPAGWMCAGGVLVNAALKLDGAGEGGT